MRSIFTILVLSLLMSCGMQKRDFVLVEGVTTKQFSSTNDEIEPYVKMFEQSARQELGDSNFKVGDVPVNFGDTTNDKYDGVCLIYQDGSKEVMIKESWWKRANQISKRIMVFHELGHCRLGRTHDDSTVNVEGRAVKTSIMNPVIPDYQTFGEHEEGYLKELFSKSKEKLLAMLNM